MYRTLLFIFSIIYSFPALGQIPIDSFYTDGTTWTNVFLWRNSPNSSTINAGVVGYHYTIKGDTTASGIQYHKLYYKTLGSYLSGPYDYTWIKSYDTAPKVYEYMGRIRIEDKKVFFTYEGKYSAPAYPKGQEVLLYNFDMKIGDTPVFAGHKTVMAVAMIDSLKMQNGQYMKLYYLDSARNHYIAEGIGLQDGLLGPSIASGSDPFLGSSISLCYNAAPLSYHFEERARIAPGLTNSCFDIKLLDVHNTVLLPGDIQLYPNPANDRITIQGNLARKTATIIIRNITGQMFYSDNVKIANNRINKTVKIAGMPAGVYYVTIASDKDCLSMKLVVQ